MATEYDNLAHSLGKQGKAFPVHAIQRVAREFVHLGWFERHGCKRPWLLHEKVTLSNEASLAVVGVPAISVPEYLVR